MTRIKVAELKNGMKFFSVYIVKSKRLSPFKGKPGNFLTLILGDNTGQVEAKIWEKAEEAHSLLNPGDLLEVKGEVREYNGSVQINIGSFRVCAENEYIPADFIPSSPRAVDEMMTELEKLMDSIGNTHLRRLLDSFFDDQEWRQRFCSAPAAKTNHQAYLGGLLEHTLNLARSAAAMVGIYPGLDRDLLLTGAILHDIGKVEEYRYDRYIDFTDEGRLLGHIVIGAGEVDRRIRHLDGREPFPGNLRLKILHIITSHHGLYEWQSPKKPKFVEAAVIHMLDMLDTTVDIFSRTSAGAPGDESWSPWSRSLERYIYLK